MSTGKDREQPTRQLLVLRHAKAEVGEELQHDHERELTARGHRAAARMGRWMADARLSPDLVLCSPARRARQTADGVMGVLRLPASVLQLHERIYEAALADLLAVLHRVPESCTTALLVGHNPGLEALVLRLSADPPHLPPDGRLFPTAALARLAFEGSWAQLGPGCARLVALVRPRELSDD